MAAPSDLGLFLGRFHIVLLHLPIGFLLLAGLLELLALCPRYREAKAASGYIFVLTVPVAIATAVCGWLLASGEEFDAELLWWHRWLGTAAAAACLLTAALYFRGSLAWHRVALFTNLVLLLAASHFGGALTHGKDFLTEHAPAAIRKALRQPRARAPRPAPTNRLDQPVFAAVVMPVLERTCVSCHGAEKAKGKLRVDALDALLKGGGAGPAVVPGKSAESELLKRILLPPDHDDHMPPEGKPQPTADEIALLKWWIDAGAPGDTPAGQLSPPAEIRRLLEAPAGGAPPAPPAAH